MEKPQRAADIRQDVLKQLQGKVVEILDDEPCGTLQAPYVVKVLLPAL